MLREKIKSDWDNYRGNNHKILPDVGWKYGGSVSFRQYLDKELCDSLWEDLIYRFNIRGLRIYYTDESEWCDGHVNKHCIIYLNRDDTIKDINITP